MHQALIVSSQTIFFDHYFLSIFSLSHKDQGLIGINPTYMCLLCASYNGAVDIKIKDLVPCFNWFRRLDNIQIQKSKEFKNFQNT
jgi:hypothetical protein